MCLQAIVGLFGNAIGIMLIGCVGFILLFYGAGLLISVLILVGITSDESLALCIYNSIYCGGISFNYEISTIWNR